MTYPKDRNDFVIAFQKADYLVEESKMLGDEGFSIWVQKDGRRFKATLKEVEFIENDI